VELRGERKGRLQNQERSLGVSVDDVPLLAGGSTSCNLSIARAECGLDYQLHHAREEQGLTPTSALGRELAQFLQAFIWDIQLAYTASALVL
jgi:hypothetical protein